MRDHATKDPRNANGDREAVQQKIVARSIGSRSKSLKCDPISATDRTDIWNDGKLATTMKEKERKLVDVSKGESDADLLPPVHAPNNRGGDSACDVK